MKVIIAGSRDFNDYQKLCEVCDYKLQNQKKEELEIVSGTARGADRLGEKYAKERGYKLLKMPAKWKELGKYAGYERNKRMAEYADALIIFWDGKSKGSESMIKLANENNLKIKIVVYGR